MGEPRARVHYELDIDDAVRAIRALNASPCGQAVDHLLHTHFRTPAEALAPDTVAERIVLLDSLWGTRLFVEAGVADRIAENFRTHSARLVELLDGLKDVDLLNHSNHVKAVAGEVLPVVLTHTENAQGRFRRNYSFATKFFHWCTRRHFPIVDGKSRTKINGFQRNHSVRKRVRRGSPSMTGLSCVQDYERWTTFYSDLLFCLGNDAAEHLRQADRDSQTPEYRVENSLLRILDKVFYYQGGGRGLGRVGA